jgi:hypothetical protein
VSGTLIFITFWQALWSVLAAGFKANPALWCVSIGWVIALMFCAGDCLERRGWRATGWGVIAASCFGLWLALAPSAAA